MPFARSIAAACIFAWLAAVHASADAAEAPARRWVYLSLNFQVAENVPVAEELFARAAKAGYNGIVLADYKLNVLDRVPDHYFRNMERVRRKAAELKLELIPCVAPFGYSEGILAHDPNLAEGLPARDVPLIVHDGAAQMADAANALPGGDFEQPRDGVFAGWDYQDYAGTGSFVDAEVRHGGQHALRFENIGRADPEHGHGRVIRKLSVRPWSQYHASAWIRSEKFTAAGDVKMFAIGKVGRVLSHSHLQVKPDQEWTEHHVVFNSLESDEINFYIGVWGGKGGKLWIDDARLEETCFVNLLRRDGCPLTITGEDGAAFSEGKDFTELTDPKMGNKEWSGSFDVFHEPPLLKVPKGSRIAEGQRLRASFYHAVTVYDGQVSCCLAEPKVFDVLEDQVRRVNKLLAPKAWFLSHDEIRTANWCRACNHPGRSAGQLLAENVAHCVKIVRNVSPNSTVCVWSDMFDPQHNAVKDYYLVNGDLAGSWEGVPKNAVVVNWNSGQAASSLPWFGRRGHPQVLAGYYDGAPAAIRDWLALAKGLASPPGVMYTTWQGQYRDLEAFAKAAWGSGE